MSADYLPVLFLVVFAVMLGGTFIALSAMLGRPKRKTTNLDPYECGVDQASSPSRPINIKFFIIAMMFLLFDVEVALLYPWATLFREFVSRGMGNFIMIEGMVFIAVLSIGLIFIFRTGVLHGDE